MASLILGLAGVAGYLLAAGSEIASKPPAVAATAPDVAAAPASLAPAPRAPEAVASASAPANATAPVVLARVNRKTLSQRAIEASTPSTRVTIGQIESGGSLAVSLVGQGVSYRAVQTIASGMQSIFDFRSAHAGDHYRLVQSGSGDVEDFLYSASSLISFHLYRDGGRYVAERQEPEIVARTTRIAGVISSSLYESVRQLGELPQLASEFAELFAWDIDFSRVVQSGDRFAVLYERIYRRGAEGEEIYQGPGRILAARFEGRVGEHTIVYYQDEDDGLPGGYYRGDGSSVERQFLVAPLRYSRISSRFSGARRHPILNVTRPHHGIDYAAPLGTPIYAVADGTVIYRGWAGSFGNLVKIEHPNGYISYYGHMSRFANGLRVGEAVDQKQVIGYVGETGLATGPHVCFRIAKDGHFVNPATVHTPASDPVPESRMTDFVLARNNLFSQLDSSPLAAATDEAL